MLAQLPFTPEQFFQVFARYNLAVWPAPWLLTGLALTAVGLIVVKPGSSNQVVSGILAALWLWMGVVYHLLFFTSINPAARLFGAAFVVQGALFLWFGLRAPGLVFRVTGAGGIIGGAFVVYALVLYPLIGYFTGHRYPATPTFGAPCPTTILTLGLLLWIDGPAPWRLVIVPAAWALIGTAAAVSLAVPQDYGLLVGGVATVAILVLRSASRRSAGRSSHRITTIPNPAQRQ